VTAEVSHFGEAKFRSRRLNASPEPRYAPLKALHQPSHFALDQGRAGAHLPTGGRGIDPGRCDLRERTPLLLRAQRVSLEQAFHRCGVTKPMRFVPRSVTNENLSSTLYRSLAYAIRKLIANASHANADRQFMILDSDPSLSGLIYHASFSDDEGVDFDQDTHPSSGPWTLSTWNGIVTGLSLAPEVRRAGATR
jgi:hypothetical protein